ncbi:UNVERIFIED_CONTAM: 3-phosphoinositide-dependent protein kinase [Sesamum radiatum]|uniref:non-specific serine/threonine protein kinase n=1 Tax=Sesamum radiatum TaxID=300843 RepID=A0AAW2TH08_SESRA
MAGDEGGENIDKTAKEFDSKATIDSNNSPSFIDNNSNSSFHHQKSKSFAFRAPQQNFSIQDFELGKIYGVGSYSKVVRAKKKDTGVVYAMKIMDKKFITKENKTAYVKLERIVLDQLDHPGVVRLFFTFQDTFSLYMALESCEGGELFDQITRKGRLAEDDARFYAAEAVDALEYIHSMGLIHRDIKPENLLLTADGHIKIADFGSVKPMQDSRITVLPNAASDDKACTFVGTAAYVPPEVLNSSPATFGRPGAGPDGYAVLKSHPFFKGIDWANLRSGTPPELAPDPRVHSASSEDQDFSRSPSHAGSLKANDGAASASEGSITRLASIDSFDSKWQQFLEAGESVLMISMVKKLQKLSSKKVQLILTNKPKLFYVDPAKLVAKGNIVWSDNPNDLCIQVVTPSNFKICTVSVCPLSQLLCPSCKLLHSLCCCCCDEMDYSRYL